MSKPTLRRWTCPTCGAGRLAPGRARRDDTRTYCLPCSESTGRLVRRVCTAAEKRREDRSAARSEKAKKSRAVARERRVAAKVETAAREKARATVYGVDLRLAAPVMWQVLMDVVERPAQRTAPEVSLHRRGNGGGFSYGHRDRITVSLRNASLGRAVEVLLHELTHKAVGNREHHGPVFNLALRAAAERLWPELEIRWAKARGYDLSRAIETALARKILDFGAGAILAPLGIETTADVVVDAARGQVAETYKRWSRREDSNPRPSA